MLPAAARLFLALVACSLVACGSEGPPDDTEASPTDDDVADAGASARDAGRGLDAGSDGTAPTARDAATVDAAPAQDAATNIDAARDGSVNAGDAGTRDAGTRDAAGDSAPPLTPALHIPLRVHRADSGLSGQLLAEVLEEMNEIWWRQAGICFEIEIVRSEAVRSDGFDFWFHRSQLGCNTNANGVYCGDHDIHSLDAPNLGRADDPAWNVRRGPARTSAHELGHGLNLEHYNGYADSNDSLMSSGRQGFKLHEAERAAARRRAQSKASANGPATPCAAVPVVD